MQVKPCSSCDKSLTSNPQQNGHVSVFLGPLEPMVNQDLCLDCAQSLKRIVTDKPWRDTLNAALVLAYAHGMRWE